MQFTYEQRFDNLLTNSKISEKDRSFIESFKSQYLRKNYLSPKQDTWLCKLEAKYAKLVIGASGTVGIGTATPNIGNSTIDQRLKALKKLTSLNSWEANFVESLTDQNARGRTLSEKQLNRLSKIEGDHSPAAKTMSKKWYENYGEEQREAARICAEYYVKNPPYYADLAKKILENKNFVPTEKQWNAITQNKYAKKVLNNCTSKPRFDVNAMVQLRKTARLPERFEVQRRLKNTIAFVLQVDVGTPESCKGGRWYNVLFAGEGSSRKVLEKDLKPAKV
tara:strand:- start:56 stop:892 length:837 start_codon:yes stop_codon:yes gene_type:complete